MEYNFLADTEYAQYIIGNGNRIIDLFNFIFKVFPGLVVDTFTEVCFASKKLLYI